MKTTNLFRAIGMIAIFILFQLAGKAQTLSISPYAGMSLDQQGAVRSFNDPGFGIMALAGVGNDMVSLGLNMDGGFRYSYQTNIKTMDLKNDSLVWRTTNAPAIHFVAALNLPPGEDGKNRFAGPIFGLAYGPGFPDKDRQPVGDFKLFLQGNYGGPVGDDKVNLGGFANISFNYLGASTSLYAWQVSVGLRISIPHAFASAEE